VFNQLFTNPKVRACILAVLLAHIPVSATAYALWLNGKYFSVFNAAIFWIAITVVFAAWFLRLIATRSSDKESDRFSRFLYFVLLARRDSD